jgi:hypothetical protein
VVRRLRQRHGDDQGHDHDNHDEPDNNLRLPSLLTVSDAHDSYIRPYGRVRHGGVTSSSGGRRHAGDGVRRGNPDSRSR